MENISTNTVAEQRQSQLQHHNVGQWEALSLTMAQQLAAGEDLSGFLQINCDRVRALTHSDRVVIYQLGEPGRGQLRIESVAKEDFSLFTRAVTKLIFDPPWLQPHPCQGQDSPEIYHHGDFFPDLAWPPVVENIVVPLVVQGQRWGLLMLQSYTKSVTPWSTVNLGHLQQITANFAIAIYQTELLHRLEASQRDSHGQREQKIIELEQINQKLITSEQKYLHLIENLHAGFVLHTADTSIILCNQNACALLGLTLDQMMGKTAIDPSWYFSCEDQTPMPLDEYPVNQVIRTGQALRDYILKINRSDGSYVWVLVNAFPEFDPQGNLTQIPITFINITQFKQAEETLAKTSQRLSIALKSGSIGCWDWNLTTNVITWDDRMYELYGVEKDKDTVVYDTWANGVHPEDIESTANLLQQAVRGEAEYDVEFRVIHPKDQSIHYIKAYGVLAKDRQGNPQSVIGINYDITQTKHIQENLQSLSNRLSLALKSGAIGCWDWDLAKNVITWDDRMYELYGVEKQEGQIVYDVWASAVHPDDFAMAQERGEQAIAEKKDYDSVFRITHPDGSIHFIEAHGVLVKDAFDQVTGIIGINFDITDRKLAELENAEMQHFLNSIIENIPDMIFVKEAKDLTFVRFNKAGAALLGYPREYLLGKSDFDLFPPDQAVEFVAKDREILKDGTILDIPEESIKTEGGQIRLLHTKKIPVLDEFGQPKYLLGISEDITDRKLKEKALEESELRFQQIATSSPAGIYILVVQPSGAIHFEYISSAFEVIFELKKEAILADARIYEALIHPEDISTRKKAMEQSLQQLSSFNHQWRIITHNKQVKWIQANSRPEVRANGDIAFYGVITDITLQIKGKERLTQIARHIPGMIYQYRLRPDGSSHFPYASDGIIDIYGVTPEAVKDDATSIIDSIDPDDRDMVIASIEQSAKDVTPWYCEYRVCLPTGQCHWLFGHSTPQLEPDGSVIWSGYISNISDRKEAEIKLAQAKEAAEEATRAKSQFLANMSHEIRTPMNGVLGMAELLINSDLEPEQQDLVQTIQDSGDSLLVIINDILDFSKIESGMLELEQKPFALKQLMNSVANLLQTQAQNNNLTIECTIDPDVPGMMMGDQTRLRQILLNLVGNAIKFSQNGAIDITITPTPLLVGEGPKDEPEQELITLLIAIADPGIGIDQNHLSQLFQPFTQADSSISRKYGGTGLGLVISKSLIEMMGGTIWVESRGNLGGQPPQQWQRPEKELCSSGCTFYLTVQLQPISATTGVTDDALDYPLYLNYQSEDEYLSTINILVAEDNKFNQKVIMLMLKKLGFRPDIAQNGLEVLAMMEQNQYDLILMDMQMPEMDGVTTTKTIRASETLDQNQPCIVALTANALDHDRDLCLEAGMNGFLTKPVKIQALETIIDNCIQKHFKTTVQPSLN